MKLLEYYLAVKKHVLFSTQFDPPLTDKPLLHDKWDMSELDVITINSSNCISILCFSTITLEYVELFWYNENGHANSKVIFTIPMDELFFKLPEIDPWIVDEEFPDTDNEMYDTCRSVRMLEHLLSTSTKRNECVCKVLDPYICLNPILEIIYSYMFQMSHFFSSPE